MKSLCWIQYLLTDESRIKEEDSVPQVFTKQLLLVAAFNQKRVNYGSERKGLVKKMLKLGLALSVITVIDALITSL